MMAHAKTQGVLLFFCSPSNSRLLLSLPPCVFLSDDTKDVDDDEAVVTIDEEILVMSFLNYSAVKIFQNLNNDC